MADFNLLRNVNGQMREAAQGQSKPQGYSVKHLPADHNHANNSGMVVNPLTSDNLDDTRWSQQEGASPQRYAPPLPPSLFSFIPWRVPLVQLARPSQRRHSSHGVLSATG